MNAAEPRRDQSSEVLAFPSPSTPANLEGSSPYRFDFLFTFGLCTYERSFHALSLFHLSQAVGTIIEGPYRSLSNHSNSSWTSSVARLPLCPCCTADLQSCRLSSCFYPAFLVYLLAMFISSSYIILLPLSYLSCLSSSRLYSPYLTLSGHALPPGHRQPGDAAAGAVHRPQARPAAGPPKRGHDRRRHRSEPDGSADPRLPRPSKVHSRSRCRCLRRSLPLPVSVLLRRLLPVLLPVVLPSPLPLSLWPSLPPPAAACIATVATLTRAACATGAASRRHSPKTFQLGSHRLYGQSSPRAVCRAYGA